MKNVLRLEWQRDPEGYRIEERQERRWRPRTIAEGDGVVPGGTFLVPRSGRFETYRHDFDAARLVSLELLNAVTPQLDLDAVVAFAQHWGLPNIDQEACVQEFYNSASDAVAMLSLVELRRGRDRGHDLSLGLQNLVNNPPDLARMRARITDDGAVRQVPHTLREYCMAEWVHAIDALGLWFGRCEYWSCGKHFVSTRREQRFCPGEARKKSKCAHAFHNEGQGKAEPPRRERVTWSDPQLLSGTTLSARGSKMRST